MSSDEYRSALEKFVSAVQVTKKTLKAALLNKKALDTIEELSKNPFFMKELFDKDFGTIKTLYNPKFDSKRLLMV